VADQDGEVDAQIGSSLECVYDGGAQGVAGYVGLTDRFLFFQYRTCPVFVPATTNGTFDMRTVAAIVIVAAVVVAVAAVWQLGRDRRKGKPVKEDKQKGDAESSREVEVNGERFTIVPSGVSKQRVVRTGLPAVGSESVANLLVPPSVAVKSRRHDEERDYRPDDTIDWVVDVEFAGSPILRRPRILKLFDNSWLAQNGQPEIYGWSPEDRYWTFVRAGGVPETYTKLAFGWSLCDPLSKKDLKVEASTLLRFEAALSDRLRQLGKATLRENRTADEAAHLGGQIAAVVSRCNREVIVILTAPAGKPYSGRHIWDVMLCLGLQWGDMDQFHWQNESSIGGDSFFSVWTSTPPGYFLPEEVAAGRVQVQDLVFGFSIPRSCDPADVFSSMMKAVKYAQQRLGGTISDEEDTPLDERAAVREIQAVVEQMKKAGFAPGEGSTLRIF
jgi:cell division protein ZipA